MELGMKFIHLMKPRKFKSMQPTYLIVQDYIPINIVFNDI